MIYNQNMETSSDGLGSGPSECNVTGALPCLPLAAGGYAAVRAAVGSSGRSGLGIAPGGGDTATDIFHQGKNIKRKVRS